MYIRNIAGLEHIVCSGLSPIVNGLVALNDSAGKPGFELKRVLRKYRTIQGIFAKFLLLTNCSVWFGMIMSFNPLFSENWPGMVKLLSVFTALPLLFALFSGLCLGGTYISIRDLIMAMNNIIDVVHVSPPFSGDSRNWDTIPTITEGMKKLLYMWAKDTFSYAPKSEKNVEAFERFEKLHKGLARLGADFGEYGLYFGPARLELWEEMHSAKGALALSS